MSERSKYDHQLLRRLDDLRAGQGTHDGVSAESRIIVHVQFTGDVEPLKKCGLNVMGNAGGIAIGEIDEAGLVALGTLGNVVHISVQQPIIQHLNTSVPEIHADLVRTGSPSFTGKKVVIGVVDDGIDIFHKNFRNEDGSTRILAIWDQTMVASGAQHPPAGYTFGVEFSQADIKDALASPGQPFAHKEGPIGHGTHVAGIAAGNGLQADGCLGADVLIGVAPEADLIIVRVIPDATSLNRNTDVGLAAAYILNFANSLSPAEPAVINMSIASGIGACDGLQPLDLYLDALLKVSSGAAIVVSAGNNGGLGDASDVYPILYNRGSHSAKPIGAGGQGTFTLLVPPDQTDKVVGEIWYSAGAGRLQFDVVGPNGAKAGPVPVGTSTTPASLTVGADTVQVLSSINTANNKGQISFSLVPAATQELHQGSWVITVTETAGTAVDADLWLQASHKAAHTVLAFADRSIAHTLTSPGTALNVITVGAYGSKDGALADFSSRGPTYASDGRQKPDLGAPGIETNPAAGIKAPKPDGEGQCCCDCCYDFYQDMQGTSQAAPHVAGVVALMLQKNPSLTFSQIRTALQTSCRTPAGVATLPDTDWGYGKVDALAAMSKVSPGPAFAGAAPVAITDPGDGGDSVPVSTASIASPPLARAMPPLAARAIPPPAALPSLSHAFAASSMRIAQAACDAAAQSNGNPALQVLISLVSKHFDEVRKLINGNRRVALRWHRMFGPLLVRRMLFGKAPLDGAPVIPASIGGRTIADRLMALFDVLNGVGSLRLRADIADYRPLFLALPGTNVPGLGLLPTAKGTHGAGRHA